jgi:hypothetical protein
MRGQGRFERYDLDPRLVSYAVGITTFALVYGFLLRGIALGRLYAFGDFVPYYGSRALAKFTGTWHEGGLGFPYVYNAMPAYLGAVTSLGGALGQNLFFIALVPACFLTFLVFVRRFVERPSAQLLAAGVYAINPLTISEFVNGGVSELLGVVGFPLVLHYLYEIDDDGGWRAVLKVAIVFGATSVVPWLVFWLVGPFALYFAFRARREPRKLGQFVVAGLLGGLLSLPNVHHILQRVLGSGEGSTVLWNTLEWNYAMAKPLAVLRLAGNQGMLGMNELGYNTEPAMVIGLVIPAVALLAVERERLTVFYVVTGACWSFIVLTGAGLTYPLFETIPLLLSVRNPVKLQYTMLLSLSVLFGAGVEVALDQPVRRPGRVLGRPDGQSLLAAAFVGLLVLSLFAYAMPAAGAFGLDKSRETDYTVPDEYSAVASDLDGPVLWLPYGYTTQLRLRDAHPQHVGIKSGGVLHGIPNVDYVSSLYRDVAAGQPVHDRLADLGVRYVVVETDPPESYGEGSPRVVKKWGAPWLYGDPATFEQRFADSSAYELAYKTVGFSVYRVVDVPPQSQVVEGEGLHAAVYPETATVRTVGENRIANPSFEDGFAGWWTPANATGRETRLVETADGTAAELSVDDSTEPLPFAQALSVRDGYPYQVRLNATGEGVATLYWYDGEKSPETLVGQEVVPLSTSSRVVLAQGDTLSVRVQPNASSTIRVDAITLRRTTYPAATDYTAATAAIPGVTVNGTDAAPPNTTVVAVNLDGETGAGADADVRIVDAETVLDAPLAFNDTYRQGVAVRLPEGERPEVIPEDARLVTHETDEGRVLDYWVVGSFDETPVTVLHTSYDEGWSGPADAEHFRVQGWANGFTDTDPDEVRWEGDGLREPLVRVWLGAWVLTLLALVAAEAFVRIRNRKRTRTLRSGRL